MKYTIMIVCLLIILMMAAILVGCDKEINRYITNETASRETVNCSYSCTEYSCDPTMDGDGNFGMDCGDHRTSCPGTQQALVRRYHLRVTYQSEKEKNADVMEIARTLTECTKPDDL